MMHGRITPAENQPAAARYEGRRGLDPLASALVLLITVGLLGPLLVYRALPEAKKLQTAVEVVNLDLPPPPPPPASPPPPKPTPVPPAAVHAPRPLVAIPAPAPPIAVQPEPVPPAPAPAAEPAPPAPPAPPQQISNNNLFATVLEATPPRYPLESRRRREEGRVLLRVLVGTDGRVARISVAQSSGHRRLDEAALAAVRKWRWRPTMRDGVGIEQSGVIPIPFVLSGSVRE